MIPCRSCGKGIQAGAAVCSFCNAAQQTMPLPAISSGVNEMSSAVGVWLAVVLLGLCFSPLLIFTWYLIGLALPLYLMGLLACACVAAWRAYRTCRDCGGRILPVAYIGYGMLVVAVAAVLVVRSRLQQADAQKLHAVQQQFGPLFYPGAQPDPDFPPAIRTYASLSDVARFYKQNRACDDRRSYGGGGDYSIACTSAPSHASVWIKLSSRVDHNEPYILIQMEP